MYNKHIVFIFIFLLLHITYTLTTTANDNTDAIALDNAVQDYENTDTEDSSDSDSSDSTDTDGDSMDNYRFTEAKETLGNTEALQQRGFFSSVVKGVKKAAKFVGKILGKKKKKKPKPKPPVRTGKDVEDCVACRYIWLQIEEAVGEGDSGLVRAEFVKHCIEGQKSTIFYNPCSMMYDQVDKMVDYYIRSYSVNQICENAKMCR